MTWRKKRLPSRGASLSSAVPELWPWAINCQSKCKSNLIQDGRVLWGRISTRNVVSCQKFPHLYHDLLVSPSSIHVCTQICIFMQTMSFPELLQDNNRLNRERTGCGTPLPLYWLSFGCHEPSTPPKQLDIGTIPKWFGYLILAALWQR